MDCESCKSVSIAYYKSAMDSKNKIIRLLVIILIVQFVGFMGYLGYLKYMDSQYDTVDEDIDVITDGGGDANYADDGSDIRYYYGEDQD